MATIPSRDLVDSMSSRSPSVSSNGTPENKEKTDYLSISPTTYSRRVADRKRTLLKEGDALVKVPDNNTTTIVTACIDRVQPSGKVTSRPNRPEQRPEQRIARRNKERERKHLVKEALGRLASLLPESCTGSRTKVTLDVVRDAADVIIRLQDSTHRTYNLESEPAVLLETNRRYEKLLLLAGIPTDTDPDVLEAQLKTVSGTPSQVSPITTVVEKSSKRSVRRVSNGRSSSNSNQANSGVSQTPYLVVSPNGSCTLSTEMPPNNAVKPGGGKSNVNPLHTLATVAVSSDGTTTGESGDSDSTKETTTTANTSVPTQECSDLLLMVACPEGDQNDDKKGIDNAPVISGSDATMSSGVVSNSANSADTLVTIGPNPGQILLAGASLPPTPLPQVLLLPDGRLVPVMAGNELSVANQQETSTNTVRNSTAQASLATVSPKKPSSTDTSAAKLSVVQPGQRAILPKIAPSRPVTTSQQPLTTSSARPIAPRRPTAATPQQQSQQTNNTAAAFPVIFFSPQAPGCPSSASVFSPPTIQTPSTPQFSSVIGGVGSQSNVVTVPVAGSTLNQTATLNPQAEQQPILTGGDLSIETMTTLPPLSSIISSSKHSPKDSYGQITPVKAAVQPSIEITAKAVEPVPLPPPESCDDVLADMVQPDVSCLLEIGSVAAETEIVSSQPTMEVVKVTTVKPKKEVDEKRKEKCRAKMSQRSLDGRQKKKVADLNVKKPEVAASTKLTKVPSKKPMKPPVKPVVVETGALELSDAILSKSTTADNNKKLKKKKTSPLAKTLTVVETRPPPSGTLDSDFLSEDAISLLIGEGNSSEKGGKRSGGIIELPLDLSVPIPTPVASKPSKKSSSSSKKSSKTLVEQKNIENSTADEDADHYGPLLRIPSKGAMKAEGLLHVSQNSSKKKPSSSSSINSRSVAAPGKPSTKTMASRSSSAKALSSSPVDKSSTSNDIEESSRETTLGSRNAKRRRKSIEQRSSSRKPIAKAASEDTNLRQLRKKPIKSDNNAKTARSTSKRRLQQVDATELKDPGTPEKRVSSVEIAESRVSSVAADSHDIGDAVEREKRNVEQAKISTDEDGRLSRNEKMIEEEIKMVEDIDAEERPKSIVPAVETDENLKEIDYENGPAAPAPAHTEEDLLPELLPANNTNGNNNDGQSGHEHEEIEGVEDHAPPPIDDDYEPPHAPRPAVDVHDVNEAPIISTSNSTAPSSPHRRDENVQPELTHLSSLPVNHLPLPPPAGKEAEPQLPRQHTPALELQTMVPPAQHVPMQSSSTVVATSPPVLAAGSGVSCGASVPLHHFPDERSPSVSDHLPTGPAPSGSTSLCRLDQQQRLLPSPAPPPQLSSVTQPPPPPPPPQQQQPQQAPKQRRPSAQPSAALNPFLLSQTAQNCQNSSAWFEQPGEAISRPQSTTAVVQQQQRQQPAQQQTGSFNAFSPNDTSCSMPSVNTGGFSSQQPAQPAARVQSSAAQPQQQQTLQLPSHHPQQQQSQQQQLQMSSFVDGGSNKRSKLDIHAVQAAVDSQLQAQASALLAPLLDPNPAWTNDTYGMFLRGMSRQSSMSSSLQNQQSVDNAMLNLLSSTNTQSNPFLPALSHQHHSAVNNISSTFGGTGFGANIGNKFSPSTPANAFFGIFPQTGQGSSAAPSTSSSSGAGGGGRVSHQSQSSSAALFQQAQSFQQYPSAAAEISSSLNAIFPSFSSASTPGRGGHPSMTANSMMGLGGAAQSMSSMNAMSAMSAANDLMSMSNQCRLSGQPLGTAGGHYNVGHQQQQQLRGASGGNLGQQSQQQLQQQHSSLNFNQFHHFG